MRTVLKVVLSALFATALVAGDVNGKWKASYTSPDGQSRESTFDLKADGATLTGVVASARGESKIQDGKLDGDNVSFFVIRSFGSREVKMSYKGKLEGDALKLTVSFGEDRTMDMTAKRIQ